MKKKYVNHDNLLDIMACAIVVLDYELHVTYMNQSAEILLSQSLHRIHGMNIRHVINSESFYQQLKSVRNQNEAHAIRAISLTLADEHQIMLDCIATPQQEYAPADRNKQGWLLLELHRIDRQMQIVRDKQLAQQQQAITELVRGLAHEVKNPLGGLRGAAQLLETELDSADLKEYTQIIISEADRLKELVDDLLGPGRIPNNERINIHEILEHVSNLVQVESDKEITLVRDYDPSIPELECDRSHLIQITLNIISNAVRALNERGTIKLRTRILRQFTIHQKRYKLVLKADICDDGVGVPEHLQDKLFLPMVSGHAEGSGLGLAIAQSLINQSGGMIQYESRPGSTCFSILLPLKDKDM
jgi:two-component system nitrogen regulation sensor histidine kinase GlnL